MKASWTGNLLLKAFALLLALLMWYYYRADQQAIHFVTVPLQFQNLPSNRELSGDIPGSVTIQMEAPEAMVRGLTPDWIDARIDLSEVGVGQQTLAVRLEQVPAGARVLSIIPGTITLLVESKIQKTLPVEPRVRGEPAPGYEVVSVRMLPMQVIIEGPQSQVERTEKAITDWIDIRGKSSTFQEGVSVVPDSGGVRLVGARSAIATVEIRPLPPPDGEEPSDGEAAGGETASEESETS